ncbi:MAG: hypothetical protein AUH29_10285 [Candidatus Rokubacteria bacterium 13_1_40CM_69_27]|nr:MAG: hypothetical protein AUH29_10285 [Candidatus Rokubacteria bacterium 13_1_40CM_69_27]
MGLAIQVAVAALYSLAILGLFLYGMNAWVMVAIHVWRRRHARPSPPAPDVWPAVTVQLPIYNERYVARRLLEAVGALDYPADRFEIQILDDSTDETTAILTDAARVLTERGLNVVHIHRRERTGFKAGALAAGLKEAHGEFTAIFDADFVPPRDFLRATISHFADPRVAVVQTRWGHLNRDFSLLTIAQALGMDGHFGVEQPARCWGDLLLNFNGTAGIWRKEAIEDAGGWTHDTLTEDLDLSYRAQLRGWRIEYRPELVCPAELPVLITGFKSQQRRWATGSIQTALKLLPEILRAPRSAWVKYQAAVHLTYYMIHPLMLAVVLLSVPLLAARELIPSAPLLVASSLIFALSTFGPACMLIYAQRAIEPEWRRRIWRLPTIMVIGVGVAWSTSLAVLGAFWKPDLTFVRTPKFGIGPAGGHWRGKAYTDHRRGGIAEIALGLYCAVSAQLFWAHGEYGVVPFLFLYTCGFLTVGALTLLHTAAWRSRARTAIFSIALAVACVLFPSAGLTDAGPEAIVAEGERWWTASPDPRNPVACATCHHDPAETRGWAASFPKFKPLPPPHGRVMTLLQANAEAVRRHYRLADPRPAATAITAYLAARGAGAPPTPGIAVGQPVFATRLQALSRSVARGAALYADRCAWCHTRAVIAPAIAAFPRTRDGGAESLEGFLEEHAPAGRPLRWDSQAIADVVAYLAASRAGPAWKEQP